MSSPSWRDLIHVFGRIGLLSFGGPAAQISLMHRELVDTRPWLSEQTYLRALSLCMLLPGPEAMQLATYAGWRLRGVAGGLLAGALFVLPGAAVIAALMVVYVIWGQVPVVQAAFLGIKAAVIAIVLAALKGLSKRALNGTWDWIIATLSFVGIFAFGLPFPLILALAALWGFFRSHDAPDTDLPAAAPDWASNLRTALFWGTLWLAPLALLTVAGADTLAHIGWFFAWLATISFGGAYALLAYMTQTVVSDFGWITTQQMIAALGLAETTPGPLILVTQFVAMLAGYGSGGFALAFAAAIVSLWATFMPCFLFIFVAAPHVERLANAPRLRGALAGITAAVVGVIANLSLWFALHVFFSTMLASPGMLPAIVVPDVTSFDATAVLLFALAAIALFWVKRSLPAVLGLSAICGILLSLLGL